MSLYGSLISGVTGLKAQTQNMAAISDNISNVSTIGYKRSVASFSSLVTSSAQQNNYSPGGVSTRPRQLIDQQGVLQSTQRSTDVAVLGAGFFVVRTADNETGEQLYTRAGSFTEDNQGRLMNAAGFYLQGWQLDRAGEIKDINELATVSVSTLNGVAVDTKNIEIGANLNATETPSVAPWTTLDVAGFSVTDASAMAANSFSPDFRRDIKVFDSLGTPRDIRLSVMKLSTPNDWAFTLGTSEATPVTGTTNVLAWGAMSFNGDGSLGSVRLSQTTAAPTAIVPDADGTIAGNLAIAWNNGASASAIRLDFGNEDVANGFTQYASDYNIAYINQNGAEVGLRTGVTIDADGFVIAAFSNGATQRIWKLPIATFANPNALDPRSGNAYAKTMSSGEFNLREASTGGAGRIEPSALETANVDLGEEFTQMITTQRAYSASARIITTADEMLDELLRVKR
jgi:flagellar hook protein FlgE